MSVQNFTYYPQPSRVIFGAGSVERLEDEIRRLGANRALILSTPGKRPLAEKWWSFWGRELREFSTKQ